MQNSTGIRMLVMTCALAALVVAPMMTPADAREAGTRAANCTTKNVQGEYGYSFSGQTFDPLFPGPGAAVGRVSVDKDGNISGSDVFSLSGLIIPRSVSGSLHVNPDCTGTATLTDSTGFTAELSFVVVGNRKEIYFIQTNAGAVVTGVMKEQ